MGALAVAYVGYREVRTQRDEEEQRRWPRAVWADFIGLCALAALVGALLTLAQCA